MDMEGRVVLVGHVYVGALEVLVPRACRGSQRCAERVAVVSMTTLLPATSFDGDWISRALVVVSAAQVSIRSNKWPNRAHVAW